MRFDAVLFDLDGTLLDTIEDLADSMNAVLAGLGFPTHDVAAYKTFVGDGVDNLARRTLPPQQVCDELVARCVTAMADQYARRWDNKTRPYDGIPQLLDGLGRRGLKMAVLSNKPHRFAQLCVSRLLGDRQFAAVQGVADGVVSKPDPAGAIAIAHSLAIGPGRFLYLGDTNTDMQTANAAGMYAVGALWGFRTAAELLDSGAKVLAGHPAEVMDVLDGA